MTKCLLMCGLIGVCGLNVLSVGGGPRSVGAEEAKQVVGGSVALAAAPPSCLVASACTGFFGCAAKPCITCPAAPNFVYVVGALVGAPAAAVCPAGVNLGACGWTIWGCTCAPPPAPVPCGVYVLIAVVAGTG